MALSHTLRVFILVFGASVATALFSNARFETLSFGHATLASNLWLLIAMGGGLWIGRRLRLPAPSVLGPLLVAGMFALVLDLRALPGSIVIILAQFCIGWSLARRFAGSQARQVVRCGLQVLGLLAVLTPIWAGFAYALSQLMDQPWVSLVFAMAPGGQAEMALLALLLSITPAFVVMAHIARVLMVVGVAGPLGARWLGR